MRSIFGPSKLFTPLILAKYDRPGSIVENENYPMLGHQRILPFLGSYSYNSLKAVPVNVAPDYKTIDVHDKKYERNTSRKH